VFTGATLAQAAVNFNVQSRGLLQPATLRNDGMPEAYRANLSEWKSRSWAKAATTGNLLDFGR